METTSCKYVIIHNNYTTNEKSTSLMVPFHKTDNSMHVTKVHTMNKKSQMVRDSLFSVGHIIVRTITDPEQIYMHFLLHTCNVCSMFL